MDGTTRYGDLDQRTAGWAAATMLKYAGAVSVLPKGATLKSMPQNKAQVVKFRRLVPFSAASTPLVEGVTPNAQRMQYEDVSITMREYGRPVEITDVVQVMAEDPVLKNASEMCGDQAGRTVEAVLWGTIKAGTNVTYANGTARTDVNTPITLALQRQITRSLKAQKAIKFTSVQDSTPNFGTQAIEAAFLCFSHTNLEGDIRSMAGFVPTALYGRRNVICEYELGAVEDVRYILSPDLDAFIDGGGAYAGSGVSMITTSGTSADVYPAIYCGKDAYASVALKGLEAITPMLVDIKPSASNPLAQRGYVSWKTFLGSGILNQNWLHRAEVAATN